MTQIIYSATARKDLSHILKQIAQDKPGTALSFVNQLQQHASILKMFPRAGTDRSDLLLNLRIFLYHGYAIYYRYHEKRVTIERILSPGHNANPEQF